MLSETAKKKLLPLFDEMRVILKSDSGIKYGECMVCGKAGKEALPMGFHSQELTFAETGMDIPILCKSHQIGWSRSANAKLFGTWFEPRQRPSTEDLHLQFALWLSTHLARSAQNGGTK